MLTAVSGYTVPYLAGVTVPLTTGPRQFSDVSFYASVYHTAERVPKSERKASI